MANVSPVLPRNAGAYLIGIEGLEEGQLLFFLLYVGLLLEPTSTYLSKVALSSALIAILASGRPLVLVLVVGATVGASTSFSHHCVPLALLVG